MNEPDEQPPATQPALDSIAQSAATRRLAGFLSGLFNAIVIGGGVLLGPVVALGTTLREQLSR
jgi:hypothetical protein